MEVPDTLPTLLWVETGLALPAVVLGLGPWLLFSETPVRAPDGYGAVWPVVGLLLLLLWLVLLGHLIADVWYLVRDGVDRLTGRGGIHAGFRAVESLGAVAAPVALQVVAKATTDGPSAHGVGAIGGLFLVLGVVAGTAVVVVLHAGWLLGIERAARTVERPTS